MSSVPVSQVLPFEHPAVPLAVANAAGHPAFGTYQGGLPEVDLLRLGGRYQLSRPERLLKHKRWHFTLVSTPQLLAVFAVADLSYTANAFVVAVDLKDKKVLCDRTFLNLPGPLVKVNGSPGEGLEARFWMP